MSPSSTSSSGLMAPIPIRIQFLSQSIFTTFNLGLTTLSVTGSRSLHYLVTSLLNFVDGQISATDPSAPPPHALGPLAPSHLRSPPTLTPSHVTGFSPGKLRDLFDRPHPLVRELFADILVAFPLLERFRVLSRALATTFALSGDFSDLHDRAVARSFLTSHGCNVWTSAGLGIGLSRPRDASAQSRCDATRQALAACFTRLAFSLLAFRLSSPPPSSSPLSHASNSDMRIALLPRPTPQARATSTTVNPMSRATCLTSQVGSLFGPTSSPETHNAIYRVIKDSLVRSLILFLFLEHRLAHSVYVYNPLCLAQSWDSGITDHSFPPFRSHARRLKPYAHNEFPAVPLEQHVTNTVCAVTSRLSITHTHTLSLSLLPFSLSLRDCKPSSDLGTTPRTRM